MSPERRGCWGGEEGLGDLWGPHTRRLKLYLNFWKQSMYCACVSPVGEGEKAVGCRLPQMPPTPLP